MSESIEDTTQNSEDSQLQLVRRLDWRFLFEEVELGHVAYGGQQDEELWQALSTFSGTLTRVSELDNLQSVDCLVLKNPSLSEFQNSLKSLKLGARFYVEFQRKRSQITLNRFHYLYISAARRLGYHHLQSNWHWPNFAEANRIIPLSSPEGLAYVYAKGRTDKKTQLKVFGLSQLVRTRLLHSLVTCLSLTGAKK